MNKLINHAYENFFRASQNNFQASTSWVQLAQKGKLENRISLHTAVSNPGIFRCFVLSLSRARMLHSFSWAKTMM